MRASLPLLPIPLAAVLTAATAAAQATPSDGLTLFAPLSATTTYLIDNSGTVLHTWPSTFTPGAMAYLLENGNLLRTIRTNTGTGPGGGGPGGGIQEIAFDGTLLWDWRHASATELSHHDVEVLPNGNVLVISYETQTQADALAAGRDPVFTSGAQWFPDYVLEVSKTGPTTGNIVWEWHAMDHLVQDFDPAMPNFDVVANRPERIDINFPARNQADGDWLHANGVDYHPGFDQVLFTPRHFGEFWILDHSTTTAEAAGSTGGSYGKGGDVLYRWGNPEAYRAGTIADQKLFSHHDANLVEPGHPGAGNIMVFNNGSDRPGAFYSSVEEVTPPADPTGAFAPPSAPGVPYGPAATTWTYATPTPTDIYSPVVSGAVRLPNGNTLVCSGRQAWLFEVDPADNIVWQYFNTFTGAGSFNTSMFKVRRYEHYLFPSAETLSAATGGTVDYELVAGTANASKGYVLVAGATGTSPGTPLPLSGLVMPLNYDAVGKLVLDNLNTPMFSNFLGTLDPLGSATAQLNLGALGASAVGIDLHFAYTLTPSFDFVSNAMPLTIVP